MVNSVITEFSPTPQKNLGILPAQSGQDLRQTDRDRAVPGIGFFAFPQNLGKRKTKARICHRYKNRRNPAACIVPNSSF